VVNFLIMNCIDSGRF